MIDVHTHCMLPEHWGPEWRDNWQPVLGRDWPRVTSSDFDQAMADGGVNTAIVFGVRATGAGVVTPHEFVAAFCRDTRARTIGFMALDLADEDVIEQLEYGVSLGLRGVKLYPVLSGADPSDPAHDPFYERATQHGLAVLWHMGATVSPVGRLARSTPLLIDEIASRHPGLVQIIAHMGSPWQRETIALLRKNRRVYADVSGLWTRPFDSCVALIRAQEFGVAPKLLFGSDYPMFTPAQAAVALRGLARRDLGELGIVATETIERLLGHDPLPELGLEP